MRLRLLLSVIIVLFAGTGFAADYPAPKEADWTA
jgi:hypothetical protein